MRRDTLSTGPAGDLWMMQTIHLIRLNPKHTAYLDYYYRLLVRFYRRLNICMARLTYNKTSSSSVADISRLVPQHSGIQLLLFIPNNFIHITVDESHDRNTNIVSLHTYCIIIASYLVTVKCYFVQCHSLWRAHFLLKTRCSLRQQTSPPVPPGGELHQTALPDVRLLLSSGQLDENTHRYRYITFPS